MLEQIIEKDQELFLFLNNLGTETWDGFWLFVTAKMSFVPLYALLLFLIYRKLGLKALLMMIVVIAAMITFTDQGTNLAKSFFGRLRPCREEGVMELTRFIHSRCGMYSFFSGHASNSMAAAVFGGLVLRPYYKKLIFILLFWSFIVAYSRIYIGVHYPLDIFFGMIYGALSGVLFYHLNKYLLKRFIDVKT